MLRDVFQQLLNGSLSRRQFLHTLTQLGVSAMAASQIADVFAAVPEAERQLGDVHRLRAGIFAGAPADTG